MSAVRNPFFKHRLPRRRHRPDYWLVLLSLTLLAVGLIVVYGISPGVSAQNGISSSYFVNKQLLAVGLGIIAFIVVANLPLNLWRKLEKPLILGSIGATLAALAFGENINGAHRWLNIGGLSFQAVELIKFALIVWLAGFLADRQRSGELHNSQLTFKPLIMVLAGLILVVAGLQGDFGSMAVVVTIMAAMIYIIGLPMKRLMMIAGIILIGVVLFIAGTGYRRDRFETFLNPTKDCLGTGYQACQSLISVGSGGLFGLGIANSVQAYGYQPKAADDSIFAILAEKFGFVGVGALLGVFIVFFARLKNIIENAPDTYSRLLVTGVLAWISTQMIINVGAMIGLLPLKGITLPFISYGGTSVLFVTAATGLAFQVSRYTTYGQSVSGAERNNYDNRLDRRGIRGAYHPNPSGRART